MSDKFHHRFRYRHPVAAVHAALTDRGYWQDRLTEVELSGAILSGYSATPTDTTVCVQKPVHLENADAAANAMLPTFAYSECWYPLHDGRAIGELRGRLGELPIRISGEFLLAASGTGTVFELSGRTEVGLPGFGRFVGRRLRAELARDFDRNCAFTEDWLDRPRQPRKETADPDTIIADIAGVLELDAHSLSADTNLYDRGMDSVRMIALVEKWRASGVQVDFPRLSQHFRVADWVAIVTGSDIGSATSESRPGGDSTPDRPSGRVEAGAGHV